MRDIPDKSVDAIICDLPYGTTICNWDVVIPFEPLWEQYKRIAKPNAAIVLFGAEPFSSILRLSNLDWFRYDIVWKKTKFVNALMINQQPGRIHEMISVFYKSHPTYNPQYGIGEPWRRKCTRNYQNKDSIAFMMNQGKSQDSTNNGTRHPTTVIEFGNNVPKGKSVHPTQKPIDLIRYLVRTYSNEGDTILDNCMGSGTTAIACIREHRHFIGFELNEDYYEKACKRIAAEMAQPTLF